jgi:hypothetical protein
MVRMEAQVGMRMDTETGSGYSVGETSHKAALSLGKVYIHIYIYI